MNNQINIIVQNQAFLLNRELLISESQNKQIKTSKDFTLPFPQWVTKEIYLLIHNYLQTKDVQFLKAHVNKSEVVVKVLRTADYLGMIKFHDKFINEVLIPNINHHNCIFLLQESHRKLKDINDSQTWYNLLNMSIIYVSRLNPMRFKKLNQKIITQILQRVIRLQRKNGFQNKHMLYQLIMQCKQAQIGNMSKLFEVLKSNLKAKKIHSKIHAKLSWKLENIPELDEKNTKNFKYLDMNWFLKANKVDNGLMVTLNLIPFDQTQNNFRSSQSQMNQTNSQKSGKSFQASSKQSQQRSENQQAYQNDTFTKIGVFYSKVHWKSQQQAFQQEIKVHYILMNQASIMDVILIDEKMQKMIGQQKVELTIFCNTQIIYTFLINYVLENFDRLNFQVNSFCIEEIQNLIKASKNAGSYNLSLRITASLIEQYPKMKEDLQLSQGYNFSKMTKMQVQIYSTLFGKKAVDMFTKQKSNQIEQNRQIQTRNSQGIPNNQKRTTSPIPITPINSIYKKANFSSSSSQLNINQNSNSNTPASNVKLGEKLGSFNKTGSGRESSFNNFNIDSSNNSRGDSRGGSKRKIFSKAQSSQVDRKQILIEQMLKVTDLSRYLVTDPVRNPQYQKLSAFLKL